MVNHLQLQRARVTLNLAISEAADLIGTVRSAISLFESGQMTSPDLSEKLRKLYESMGIEFGQNGQIGVRPDFMEALGSRRLH